MRTLLIESSPGVGLEAAYELVAAGHEVLRCQPEGAQSFPCTDLTSPGSCPLHGVDQVDVALVTRAARDLEPTTAEAGVTCALRAGVPVTVLGHPSARNPYAGWSEAATCSDPVQACMAAVDSAREAIVAPLRQEVVRMVTAAGGVVDDGQIDVVMQRADGRVHLEVIVPKDLPVGDETIATHVHSIFRDRATGDFRTVDVAVTHHD